MRETKGFKRRFEAIKRILMENKIMLALAIIIAVVVFLALWNWSLKASTRHVYDKRFSVEWQRGA